MSEAVMGWVGALSWARLEEPDWWFWGAGLPPAAGPPPQIFCYQPPRFLASALVSGAAGPRVGPGIWGGQEFYPSVF